MEPDKTAAARTRALLALPEERGALYEAEMDHTRRRIDAVGRAPVSWEDAPGGGPRLGPADA